MVENVLDMIADFHRRNHRQGPGSDEMTLRALEELDLDDKVPLHALDIGCGTGAQTLVLARYLKGGRVTAVDLMPQFLDELRTRAMERGLADRITVMHASMDALRLPSEAFDLIWSEGAVYHLGLAKGVALWRDLLKPGGHMMVSDLTWLTPDRPEAIHDYWIRQYPRIDTIENNIKKFEEQGYAVTGHFVLPDVGWFDNYYKPLLEGKDAFLERHRHEPGARELVAEAEEELVTYRDFRRYYGYVYYLARRT